MSKLFLINPDSQDNLSLLEEADQIFYPSVEQREKFTSLLIGVLCCHVSEETMKHCISRAIQLMPPEGHVQ